LIILAQQSTTVIGIIAAAVGVLVGGAAMTLATRLIGIRAISDARNEAQRLTRGAQNEADTIRKQTELDSRNELAKLREEHDRHINDQRNELKEVERRHMKREDTLDRKLDALGTKEKYLDSRTDKLKERERAVAARDAELEGLLSEHKQIVEKARAEQKQALLKVAGLSEQEAQKQALKAVEQEVAHEAAQIIQRQTEQAEEESRENSLKITLQAIQRYATEHTADFTVSAIPIASDDMKGRVIGREGRNIRAFEKATGVDVIVDDTPGVVVLSCFDPVRRAIASESLSKLLDDGRIHPTRIEEIVEQMQKEVQDRIVKFGRDAAIESNIQGLHPRISEMMGRLHYRMSYGQNILRHSHETAFLCQIIAEELGLDGETARRCGFLHDIGKAMDHEVEGGHPAIGADFCKKFGEKETVLNAVAGHHNDIPSTTPYTPIVMAADAISGARPGARRETLERYVKRLEQLEEIATGMNGVQQAFAIQAGREVRVIVDPASVDDNQCVYIAREIAKKVSEEMTFPGEIRITLLREMRTVEFAK